MMASKSVSKQSQIDIGKIISDKRLYDFNNDDNEKLKIFLEEIKKYQKENPDSKCANLNIDNPEAKFTKSQKKKLKRKSKINTTTPFKQKEGLTPMGNIMEEVTASLGLENPLNKIIESKGKNLNNINVTSISNVSNDASSNVTNNSNSINNKSNSDINTNIISKNDSNIAIDDIFTNSNNDSNNVQGKNIENITGDSINNSNNNTESISNSNNTINNSNVIINNTNDDVTINDTDSDQSDDDNIASSNISEPVIPSKREIQKSPHGYDWPLPIACEGFLWTYSMKLPPVIEMLIRMLRGIFSIIKDSDVSGKNIMVYPPANERSDKMTIVPRATHGCAARIIASLGSIEQIKFEVSQGRHQANCEYFLSKNQAIFLGFGICSSVAFSYDDKESFLFKINANSRGIKKSKSPTQRWVIVIDFISDSNALDKEFKKVTTDASKGDAKFQKSIEEKLGSFISDTDLVSKSASAKAAAAKLNAKPKEPVHVDNDTNSNNNNTSVNSNNNNNDVNTNTSNNNTIDSNSNATNSNNNATIDLNVNNKTPVQERKISRQERRLKEAALAKAQKKMNKKVDNINVEQIVNNANQKVNKEKQSDEQKKEQTLQNINAINSIVNNMNLSASKPKEDWSIDENQ